MKSKCKRAADQCLQMKVNKPQECFAQVRKLYCSFTRIAFSLSTKVCSDTDHYPIGSVVELEVDVALRSVVLHDRLALILQSVVGIELADPAAM